MRTLAVIESQDANVSLSQQEAEALRAAGRRLASTSTYWGADTAPEERSVLGCRPRGRGRWTLRVRDAVGVIAIPGLQVTVEPKIPVSHLLYLFAHSGAFPRLDAQRAQVATSRSLWELVARWLVGEMEQLLRHGLMRDYHDATEESEVIRGRIDVPNATRAYYSGRTTFLCHFEEFGFDSPLNRVLLAACRVVSCSQALARDLRREAARVTTRLGEVGDLRPTDLRATVDRRTRHYRDAVLLAQHVIRSSGRAPRGGDSWSQSFLIRTPEMVEAGLRTLLARLAPGWHIRKQGIRLPGSTMTFNPDLVLGGGAAIADVKYKLATGDWNRADFNQVVTFATAYRSGVAAIVNFRTRDVLPVPGVTIGDMSVDELSWPADVATEPADAADQFAAAVSRWLIRKAAA